VTGERVTGGAEIEPGETGGLPWRRFVAVLVLVALDLWTKSAVFGWLDFELEGAARDVHGHWRYTLVEPWLGLMLSCNPGAAFGNFGDYPHLLVAGRVVAIAVLAWVLLRADPGQRSSFVAVVLVLAGAAGNLADNLGLGCADPEHPYGLVRDFLDVWFVSEAWGWDWHFPTFNLADSCISVGAGLWILSGLLRREDAADPDVPDGDGA